MGLKDDLRNVFPSFFRSEPQEVIVEQYDTESQDIIVRDRKESTIFRPKSWAEYIGQERAKERLQIDIKGATSRNKLLGHVLIHGQAGMGKTTLAKLISHELGVELTEVLAGTIEQFWKFEMMIRQSAGQVLFLDEIHAMDRKTAEKIYTIMEDFSYNGKELSPFTLIGATTEIGEILQKMKPFYDRFKFIVELEPYKLKEMVTITKQFKQKIFPVDTIPEEWYTIIALNCRGVPRSAIRILEETIYFNDIHAVLKNHGIIKDGYTDKDLWALQYIAENEKGAGLQSIASYLNTATKNYLYHIEPYLLQNGMISRTSRGRKITAQGEQLIEELSDSVQKKYSSRC